MPDNAADPGATVRTVMLLRPRTLPPAATVDLVRAEFADDHIHAVLITAHERLLAVLVRDDLLAANGSAPALLSGRVTGRIARPDADLAITQARMVREQLRRLAVVNERGDLLGLLCLKRTGRGFCSAADVAARAIERAGTSTSGPPRPT